MKSYDFSYTPKKLISVTEKIKKVFPTIENLQAQKENSYTNLDIRELLEKIKTTKKEQLKYLARSLKNRDLYTLVYNLDNIDVSYIDKVITVLLYRNKKRLVKIMWKNYCNAYKNENLNKYFSETIKVLDNMNFTDPPYIHLKEMFENNPLNWIVNHFYQSNLSYYKCLSKFEIKTECELAHKISLNLFTIPYRKVFEKEDTDTLCQLLSSYKIQDILSIIENYLELYVIKEFNTRLMTFFIDRLGKPTEDSNLSWQKMKTSAYNKARQWYVEKELTSFFDSLDDITGDAERRFNYWRKYMDYIKDAIHKPGNSQLFLVFSKFAVIEFGEVGNAAYIYRRYVFDEYYRKYMHEKYDSPNTTLKNKDRSEYRIIHQGNWESRADEKLKESNLL